MQMLFHIPRVHNLSVKAILRRSKYLPILPFVSMRFLIIQFSEQEYRLDAGAIHESNVV